jgi:hypothetical protein
MAIEASLRDLEQGREGSEAEETEEEKEADACLVKSAVRAEHVVEEAPEPAGEQIESSGEYKYDNFVKKKRKETNIKHVKEKKEKHMAEKEERKKKECDSALEGLSESDIKSKLIESAKIKSKVSRQSLEGDKPRKKLKKETSEIQAKEKKRKSSCDVQEDLLLSKKRKSSVSKERLTDRNNIPRCDSTVAGRGAVVTETAASFGSGIQPANSERSTTSEKQVGKPESTKSGKD